MACKIYFDTETTGFKPGSITQLALIMESENGDVNAANYFFKVDYMTPGAEEVTGHGIEYYEEMSGGHIFADKAKEIYRLFEPSVIYAHNAKFDQNFMFTEFWRCGITYTPKGVVDTMTHYTDIMKMPGRYGKYKNPKLSELVDFLNIDIDKMMTYCKKLFNCDEAGYHDARMDATAVFVICMLTREKENGMQSTGWHDTFCKK